MKDSELISATLMGDHRAFQSLVEIYEPRVAATVVGMLGRCPEADDVGQETFIRFYKGLAGYKATASVGTYITRIAINLSLNELKRRKRRTIFSFFQHEEAGNLIDGLPDPAATSDYDDTRELVHGALQRLDPKFRSVLVLRLLDGYSTNETAQILQLPIGTVLSRLTRAQQKLKDILTPYMGEYHEPLHS